MDALKRQLESQRRQIEALKQSHDQSHDQQDNELLASQLQALQVQSISETYYQDHLHLCIFK